MKQFKHYKTMLRHAAAAVWLFALILSLCGCRKVEITTGEALGESTLAETRDESRIETPADTHDEEPVVIDPQSGDLPEYEPSSQTSGAETAQTSTAVSTTTETTTEPPTPPPDVTPPVIEGAADITVEAGGTVSYKKDISVTDDEDPNPVLEIDNSGVNLNTEGIYPVTYTATDASGNSSFVTINVTVIKKIAEEADFELMHKLAKAELDECLYSGMSDMEKLWTIFWHVKYNMKYSGNSDKESWVIEAIRGFREGTGDCYTYYSVLKALLEEAGFETIDMTRLGGPTKHFWSLVNYNGAWYHIDACPRSPDHGKYWYCFLRTDAQVAEFTEIWGEGYYYVYDESLCPRTAEDSLHTGYDINGEGHEYYEEDYE